MAGFTVLVVFACVVTAFFGVALAGFASLALEAGLALDVATCEVVVLVLASALLLVAGRTTAADRMLRAAMDVLRKDMRFSESGVLPGRPTGRSTGNFGTVVIGNNSRSPIAEK